MMRTTSSLLEVHNDTGRIAFCGPYVLSAITGYPVSRIEEVIHQHRAAPTNIKDVVKGTTADEVAAALAAFDYNMVQVETYMHLERKQRPTLWTWMQRPRNAWKPAAREPTVTCARPAFRSVPPERTSTS